MSKGDKIALSMYCVILVVVCGMNLLVAISYFLEGKEWAVGLAYLNVVWLYAYFVYNSFMKEIYEKN